MTAIYFQKRFTAHVSGTIVRQVTCERCSFAFEYDITRTAAGYGISPYGVNDDGAARRAANHAERNLAELLAHAADPVPCPECGWLQADMVQESRARQWGTLRAVAISILFMSLLSMVLGAMLLLGSNSLADEWRTLFLWTGTPAAIAAALLIIRWLCVKAINPNAGEQQRRISMS